MTIERYRAPGVERFDEAPSIGIRYDADAADRSWSSLPATVRTHATDARSSLGFSATQVWAEVAWPDIVRRDADGAAYRQRLGWCAAPAGLLLVDARQPGRLAAGRFTPERSWQVRTMHRTADQAGLKHRAQQARAVSGGRADDASDVSGYGGSHPRIWTTLPSIVCAGMQHFLADAAMRHELGDAQVAWGDGRVTEQVWYERRGEGRATGAALHRTLVTSIPVRGAEHAAGMLAGAPWTVTAWRCELTDARGAVGSPASRTLPRSGRAPLPPRRG